MINHQELTIIISLFSLGLFGGFSHCVGMCGPFVLTQANIRLSEIKIDDPSQFKRLSGVALIPYHLGRISTYCFIGVISSFLAFNLKELVEFKLISGLLLILASVIFSSMALTQFKFKLSFAPKFINFNHRKIKKLIDFLFLKPYKSNGYFLGIILGFIPCGLLYGAIVTVSSIDSYLISALAMLAFGIGTIPSLFLTGYSGYLFFDSIKGRLKLFSKIILLINALTLLIMAIGLIFNKI